MKRHLLWLSVITLSLGIVLSNPSKAEDKSEDAHFAGSSVKLYSKGYSHIDVGYYIQKLKDIFFTEEFKKKYPVAGMIEKFYRDLGYFAIKDYIYESRMSNVKIYSKETLLLSKDYPDSILYILVQLPDRNFKIGSLFAESDYVFLLAINNYQEVGKILFSKAIDAFKSMGEAPPELNQMMGFLQFFQVREELKDALGKELDILLFDTPNITPPPTSPQDVFFAVITSVENYQKAEELLKTASGVLGFSMNNPSFESSEWRFYEILQSNVFLGLTGEWLVLTSKPKEFVKLVIENRSKFHQDLPCSNVFMRINANRLFRELGEPAIEMLRQKMPSLATREIAYFFDITPNTELGKIEITCTHGPDSFVTVTEMDDEVVNGALYLITNALEFAVMKGMEMKKEHMHMEMEEEEGNYEEEAFDSRVPF